MYLNPMQLCQIELYVHDLERALEFYKNVFGWPSVPAEIHNYVILDVPRESPFGIALVVRTTTSPLQSHGPVLYFKHDFKEEGLEGFKKRIEEAGGRLIHSRHMPSYGAVLHFADTEGISWGVYDANAKALPLEKPAKL